MSREPGRFRRLAAMLLPFVIGARALLLVYQLHNERKPHAAAPLPPAWPATVGEVLRFRSDSAGLRGWAAQPDHAPLSAALLERLPARGARHRLSAGSGCHEET